MFKIMSIRMVVMGVLLWAGGAHAVENGALVLFDQGHDQRFLIEKKGDQQLTEFADIIRRQGGHVASTKEPLNDKTLSNISALVISGPFESLKAEEVEAVVRFIERGGRLAAMLHIGPPLAGLLTRLDIDISNTVLHERKNVIDKDLNFRVTDLTGSPLFAGLTQFSIYGGWALDPGKTGTTLARTSPEAWVDLDGDKVLSKGDMIGTFNVVVSGTLGTGSFFVFADDAIFQNRYLDENNSRLAANLAGWLTGR